MKVLVVLANYGTSNDAYLQRVLEEYRQMPYDVDLVVLSNVAKNLGPEVELVLTLPPKNPYAFPFAHKKILAERMSDYDLFIYSEDDTLYTQRNIEAFLRATEILPEDEIAGFLNTETDGKGNLYFANVNLCHHWDPTSVKTRGGYTFAYFTNEHSASYVLTRRHLQQAVKSGGFLVEPHEGRYQLRESAATDPYTQCGFRKMICLSHLDDFLIRHLPGVKFASRPFAARVEFQRQIEALLSLNNDGKPRRLLFDVETKCGWSKDYYERSCPELVSLIPDDARSALSIGCGWGDLEGHLVQKGLRVVGVPLDSVIAACAEAKGVEIVYGDFQTAREKLANQSFDCLLLSNVLHLVHDPAAVLSAFAELLSPRGVVIASAPNLGQMPVWLGRLRGKTQYRELGSFEKTGLHMTSARLVRKWFKHCRLNVDRIEYMIPPRAEVAHRLLGGVADPLIGEELIARGRKTSPANDPTQDLP